jgi:hypothetical protein
VVAVPVFFTLVTSTGAPHCRLVGFHRATWISPSTATVRHATVTE